MTKSYNYMFIMLLGGVTFTEFYQEDVSKTWIDQAAIAIFVTFVPVFFAMLLINFLLVRTDGQCSPRHQTHFEPPFYRQYE